MNTNHQQFLAFKNMQNIFSRNINFSASKSKVLPDNCRRRRACLVLAMVLGLGWGGVVGNWQPGQSKGLAWVPHCAGNVNGAASAGGGNGNFAVFFLSAMSWNHG
jgi:hypothetical protein